MKGKGKKRGERERVREKEGREGGGLSAVEALRPRRKRKREKLDDGDGFLFFTRAPETTTFPAARSFVPHASYASLLFAMRETFSKGSTLVRKGPRSGRKREEKGLPSSEWEPTKPSLFSFDHPFSFVRFTHLIALAPGPSATSRAGCLGLRGTS